ncbi:tryptase-2-like [Clinocottus analis]|uniref:tryptase-2-like n=1 Tax=Clinocottus analis TaxID=304258 RepID=UPI0035C20AAC
MRRRADSADKSCIKLQPAEPELHSIAAMAFAELLTVLVLIHNPGGLLGAEVKSAIIGGTNAQRNDWPWITHLNLTDLDEQNHWRCGGSIIHEQWVLTSASCLKKVKKNKSMVVVGAYQLKKAAVDYIGIENYMIHPKFKALSSGGYVNDIAVVKLEVPIPTSEQVKVVSLPEAKDTPSLKSKCWIAGWGNIQKDKPLPGQETLQQLKIPLVSNDVCKTKRPELTVGMLCAGGEAGEDACKGDYGGPLVCNDGDGYVQVGIISYSDCGGSERPGVYTKVSEHLDFIAMYGPPPKEAAAEM